MLNFDTMSGISAKQTRTTQIRHDDRLASLIEPAALALAVDKSVFLRAASEREALACARPAVPAYTDVGGRRDVRCGPRRPTRSNPARS